MLYPKTCPDCGNEVKPLLDKETNIFIPTCTGCEEWFLDEELVNRLDEYYKQVEPNEFT